MTRRGLQNMTDLDYQLDAVRMTHDADMAADSQGLDRDRFWDALDHFMQAGWLFFPSHRFPDEPPPSSEKVSA